MSSGAHSRRGRASATNLPTLPEILELRRKIEDAESNARARMMIVPRVRELRRSIELELNGGTPPQEPIDGREWIMENFLDYKVGAVDKEQSRRVMRSSVGRLALSLFWIDQILLIAPRYDEYRPFVDPDAGRLSLTDLADEVAHSLTYVLACLPGERHAEKSKKGGRATGAAQARAGAITAANVERITAELRADGVSNRPRAGELGLAEQVAARLKISPDRVRQIWRRAKPKQA